MSDIFTDKEDKIIEQLKSTVYYSSGNPLSEIIDILKSTEKERAADILQTTLSQIGFEQKQRRDYVLSSLGINIEKTSIVDAEVFARAIGNYGNDPVKIGNFISTSKLDNTVFKLGEITDEILEQAKTFNTVAGNLENTASKTIYKKRIRPLIIAIKKLPPDRLSSVIEQTKDYIHRVEQLGDDIVQKNPGFSNAMKQLFELTGLSIISNKKETVGEKLGFCGDVLLTAELLSVSKKQSNELSEEQLERIAGLWLYNLEGAPLAEDILNS